MTEEETITIPLKDIRNIARQLATEILPCLVNQLEKEVPLDKRVRTIRSLITLEKSVLMWLD